MTTRTRQQQETIRPTVGAVLNYFFGFSATENAAEPVEPTDPYETKLAKLTALYQGSREKFIQAAHRLLKAYLAKQGDTKALSTEDVVQWLNGAALPLPTALTHLTAYVEVWRAQENTRRGAILGALAARGLGHQVHQDDLDACEDIQDYDLLIELSKAIRSLYAEYPHQRRVVQGAIARALRLGWPRGGKG